MDRVSRFPEQKHRIHIGGNLWREWKEAAEKAARKLFAKYVAQVYALLDIEADAIPEAEYLSRFE